MSVFYLSTETALGVYLVEFPAVISLRHVTVEHTVSHDVRCHQQPATDIFPWCVPCAALRRRWHDRVNNICWLL